ncbi:MAG: hypothetical protein EHM42_13470 [Planctomycetaceae bacterium]|nr:MAG: hypothetical protein EHM42_13470 [Planctomycetaceae bacterium]
MNDPQFIAYRRDPEMLARDIRVELGTAELTTHDLIARLFDDQPEREHVRYHLLAYALKKLVRSGLIARRKVGGHRVYWRTVE